MTDTMRHTRPLSLVEVEERILNVIDAMETASEEYEDLAREAALSEADYKRDVARTKLAVIQHGDKMTVGERDAKVDAMTADAHKQHLLATAARNSKREYLTTLRSHLDALRTLNASIRGQV